MLMRFTLFILIFISFSQVDAQIINTFPYIDNFEGSISNWQATGAANTWKRGEPSMTQINSAYSGNKAWMTDTLNIYPNNRLDFVQSPLFNFSNLTQAPYLRFKYNMKTESCCDNVKLQFTLDEQNWITVGTHNSGQNWYNDSTVDYWSGNSNGWQIASHILNGIPQTQNVRFRFLFFSDYSQRDEGFAFDDFEIIQSYTDAGIVDLLQPAPAACDFSNAASVSVEVENLGQAVLNNISVSYQLDSNAIVTETLAQINEDTSVQFVFSQGVDLSADSSYKLKVWINANNDTYPINDTIVRTIINLEEISQFPYFTDFDSGQGEWTAEGENSTWAFGTPMKSIIRSANSGDNAWVTGNTGFGLYNNNENSYVLSPCFNTSSLTSGQVRMAIWWESESDYDGANLQFTTNDGLTWQNLNKPNAVNWYNNTQIDGLQFTGNTEGWSGNTSFNEGSGSYLPASIEDNLLAGNSSLRFRLNFGSDVNTRDEGIAFDDFYFGETLANDMAVISANKLRFDLCQNESDSLFATIQNFGSNASSNFSVNYEYGSNSGSVNYSASLNTGASDEVYLGSITATDTGDFIIKIFHSLSGDGFNQNDTLLIPLTVYADKANPISNNVQICDSSRALLIAGGDGLVQWYSDMTRNNLVFVGDTFLTGLITSDSTFYLSNSIGEIDTLGPVDNTIGSGSYTNVDARTRIQITEYTSILSAKIYGTFIGNFDISIEDEQGNTLQTKTFNVNGGVRRIYLGFNLTPGNYIMRVHNFGGLLTLYRNTSGAEYGTYSTGYISLLGNNFDPEFYYYLYDLRVSNSEPCEGESSVQVSRGNIAPIADFSIDREKNRFTFSNRSQSARTFTWLFENLSDGTLDSSSSINPTVFLDSGSYIISLIARSDCGTDTISRNYEISEISVIETFDIREEYKLKVFPNPVNDKFTWQTEAPSGSYEISVRDIMGREVYKSHSNIGRGEILTQDWNSGYYILQISSEQSEMRTKFIVH